jgi:hypothetical protein
MFHDNQSIVVSNRLVTRDPGPMKQWLSTKDSLESILFFGLVSDATALPIGALSAVGVTFLSSRRENTAISMAEGYASASGRIGAIIGRRPSTANAMQCNAMQCNAMQCTEQRIRCSEPRTMESVHVLREFALVGLEERNSSSRCATCVTRIGVGVGVGSEVGNSPAGYSSLTKSERSIRVSIHTASKHKAYQLMTGGPT